MLLLLKVQEQSFASTFMAKTIFTFYDNFSNNEALSLAPFLNVSLISIAIGQSKVLSPEQLIELNLFLPLA